MPDTCTVESVEGKKGKDKKSGTYVYAIMHVLRDFFPLQIRFGQILDFIYG